MSRTKKLNKTTTKSKASANKVAVANKLLLNRKSKAGNKDIESFENKKSSDSPVKNSVNLWSSNIQTKLKIGAPGGKLEKEADAMADKVVNNSGQNQIGNSNNAISKKEKEQSQAKLIQRQGEEKEEPVQTKLLQRQGEEKEEPAQAKFIQKQEEEKEEPAQAKLILRQAEEKEETAQTKIIQRQGEEKEEPVQTKLLQRQEEKEESAQAKLIQKQEEEKEEPVQAKHIQREGGAATAKHTSSKLESKLSSTRGQGSHLPENTRNFMENGIGSDFSKVKIHTGNNAVQMNKDLGAQAFTQGNNIYFNSGKYNPENSSGKHLLAHELTHTVQQKGGRPQTIQKLGVDDVTGEMKGKSFELVEDLSGIKRGTVITIVNWNGTKPNTYGYYRIGIFPVPIVTGIPKRLLKPTYSKVKGVSKYEVGVGSQRGAVKKSQQKLDDWKAKEASYKKNRALWEKELKRLEALHVKKEKTMSRMLLRETMYNRFDADIVKWVDYYNKKHNPKTKLSYNIVKSILFQETRMGTSGAHLLKGPYNYGGSPHPIKSRFNIGQVIDSFGPQQYLMIKEMSPTIYKKYDFDKYEKGAKWKGMTGKQWWNANFRAAIKEFSKFKNAIGENLMGNKKELFLDYAFWIRATVKWLFRKYDRTKSWAAAVKDYNGSGAKATIYKKEVLDRANKSGTVIVGNK